MSFAYQTVALACVNISKSPNIIMDVHARSMIVLKSATETWTRKLLDFADSGGDQSEMAENLQDSQRFAHL
jgi:hypothetical protein